MFLLQHDCDFELAKTRKVWEKTFQVEVQLEGADDERLAMNLAEKIRTEGKNKKRVLKSHLQSKFFRRSVSVDNNIIHNQVQYNVPVLKVTSGT